MFWWILFSIICLIWLLIIALSIYNSWDGTFIIALTSLIFVPFYFIFIPANDITADTPVQETGRIEIYAMNEGSQIHKSGFLFSQTINEELVYKYLTKDNNGGFSVNTIPSKGLKVYADLAEEGKGYIINYKQETKQTFWKIGNIHRFTEIHIPQSSAITNDFIIDLQ